MSYFLANLGRRYTSSRSIECLLSAVGLTVGTTNYQIREGSDPWTPSRPFAPYAMFELSEALGDKTIELMLDDGVNPAVNITQTVTLVESNEPYVPWTPETQFIANNLPEFHPGRRLRSSNWQTFLNGPSKAVEIVVRDGQHVANARFLASCPVNELDQVGEISCDPTKANAPKADNANRLVNPSLSLLRTPFTEPQDWALKGGWSVDTALSLFGYNSLQCAPANNVQVSAVQALEVDLKSNDKLSIALYYRSPEVGTRAVPTNEFALKLVLLYEDGTSDLFTTFLAPGTDSRWALASVVGTAAQVTYRAFAVVVVTGQAYSPFNLNLGGLTAHVGAQRESFSFGKTKPFFLQFPLDTALEPSKELWLTGDAREFEREIIPTRIDEATLVQAGAFTSSVTIDQMFRLEDAVLNSVSMGFAVSNAKAGLYVVDPLELIKEYSVAFYDQGAAGYIVSTGFQLEAVTWFNGRLWGIGVFSDSTEANKVIQVAEWGSIGAPVDGTDRTKYLVALNSQLPALPTDYIEVQAAWPLKLLPLAEPAVSMAFEADDPNWVHFKTATEEYKAAVHYDVGFLPNLHTVWTREVGQELTIV
jgi:hypothetical protein